jgi:hypothetical protein
MAAATLSRKEILAKVQKMVPPMLESFHKGKPIRTIAVSENNLTGCA